MKKSNKKHKYLMGFILTVLAWIVYVQTPDTAGLVRTASANQVFNASAVKLPGEGLDLFAFSPDGKTLASTNANGQIVLWDVASGQARLTLPGQVANSVSRLVFSPDGNTLASVSDNSIRLWDTTSGNVRLNLPGSALVTDLAFSPDGRTLAIVGQDARVTLRDSQSGVTIQILTGDPSGVNAIEFSPDSKILATGGQDAGIKLWDSATGQEKTSLPGVVGAAVTDLVYSPNGKILAAVSQDARITLWDSQSGSATQVLSGDPSGVNAIAFSPDSKILAAGGQNAQIKLWDSATGKEQANLPGESGVAVTGLVFSPDGKSLASVGESEPVYLWDVVNKLPRLLTGHTDWVDKVIFSANQKTLTSVGKTGQVVVWNVMTGLEQSFFQVPALSNSSVDVGLTSGNLLTNNPITNTSMAAAAGSALPNGNGQTVNGAAVSQSVTSSNKKKSNHDWKGVTALAVSPDGTLYGGATKDGTVRLWTSDGTERFSNLAHHDAVVTGVAFSADGKGLISVGRDSEIHTWDAATGKLDKVLQGHESAIRTVATSPDGKYIASAGEETRVMLWDAQTGKLLKILTGQTDFINAVSFSADSSQLASAGADSRILVWDVKTGQLAQTLLGHLSEVNGVAFSKDGKFLASGSTDSQVILWDAATGQQLQSFSEHQASVRAVAFSPNGQKLVSAGEDNKIMVWDTKTRKLVNQISGSANPVSALVFHPLGHLMAGSEDGDITEWDVEKGEKQQIINVPVQPQSNISGKNLKFPFAGSSQLVAGNTGYPADTMTQNSTKLELSQVFYRLMDWLIPAAEAAIPNPPGGPILVVTSTCPTCGVFNQYYAEILRAEGFNEFAAADISTITAATLAAYDVVILASTPLTTNQAGLFISWVNGGGNLIAIRPDPQLASLLGLTANGTVLSNAYLLVDTTRAPGNGIVNQPVQFHGAADGYSLNGATSLATLYSNASTATTNPALTLVTKGGGQAAAFTYDLATSIVYTRQGNPAWQVQERDGLTPIRSDDKYYGNATGDPQLDWVDLNNLVAVPQADEQQRLLANLITWMNLAKKPLPRFWYFPNGKKAVIIMTGDDHGNGGTGPRFDQFNKMSPAGCNVSNWECVRGTSYIFVEPTNLSNTQAAAYTALGFEVGLHINTNCLDFNLTAGDPQNLNMFYVQQLAAFQAAYPSIPAPITQRHHCIAWSDWTTGAKTELNHGMRLDTSYYFWPPGWLKNRPGNFTGSAMPMRFADLSGNLIDVYQSVSHMTDESGQTYPFTVDTLLNRALGTPGYYGAYTINAHTDLPTVQEATYTVNSALARSVPVVSSVQMLTWLDGRNNSSFGNLSWNGNVLGFKVTPGTGANGLQAMLPTQVSANSLVSLTTGLGNSPVAFTTDTIKGINYAFFPAASGNYTATYQALPLTINATVLPGAYAAVPYSATVTAKGGTLPYSWSIVSGALPAGLVLNPGTGAISGTPTTSGTFNFSIKVTDSTSPAGTSTQALSITVSVPAYLTIWPGTTQPGVIDSGPDSSVELGVKFSADTNGTITGIRFYKASTNTGIH
ncbi:MAG: putative Ig domain-containing protein, partial [Methylococcaceae bacterium]